MILDHGVDLRKSRNSGCPTLRFTSRPYPYVAASNPHPQDGYCLNVTIPKGATEIRRRHYGTPSAIGSQHVTENVQQAFHSSFSTRRGLQGHRHHASQLVLTRCFLSMYDEDGISASNTHLSPLGAPTAEVGGVIKDRRLRELREAPMSIET
ncbi:hypothetical protein P171DRAFT_126183 [Karstenula rhodostoma CBS 690.94]|uniref:Uncharacterized protein n=1 Tax=Karstenula rhodostoma CBS 690.94 TaxID=1392251 RepID=A0A9P4P9A3_9PLEO|nr:hypothetical protein P171DRAFT_126183 [Karstenula rhodostoma CBS 690.94]